jgi:hypothetical protein
MEITFADHHLQEECESERALRRTYGDACARCVMARLADLQAAETLDELRRLPGGCCHHDGDRRDALAIELSGGKKMLLAPARPKRAKGRLDWGQVDAVLILTITDDRQDPRARARQRGGGSR